MNVHFPANAPYLLDARSTRPITVTHTAFVMPVWDMGHAPGSEDFLYIPCEPIHSVLYEVWVWNYRDQTWEYKTGADTHDEAVKLARAHHTKFCRPRRVYE